MSAGQIEAIDLSIPQSTTEENKICCLMNGTRHCRKLAGKMPFTQQLQAMVIKAKLNIRKNHRRQHNYICSYHNNRIVSFYRRQFPTEPIEEDGAEVGSNGAKGMPDLSKLELSTLVRYARHYKINFPSKVQRHVLEKMVAGHFKTIPVEQSDVIGCFAHKVKSNHGDTSESSSNEEQMDD